ncbi:MAG: MFS transporter [Acidimicrobiales bacterium]
MTTAAVNSQPKPSRLKSAFLTRQLDQYPGQGMRIFYLGIVVITTMTLYYLYYVEGAVVPLILPYYHMSFLYFLYLLVVSNAVGAATAFIGGLSDRIGRANLTIMGTLIIGLVQLVGVPNIHSKFGFALAYVVIGFVEGIILVSTPAMIRDFSPQMGRASAMGFWALGPVVGSLVSALVANHTLAHLPPWQDQFVISGVVCMVIVVIAFFGLRELSPKLRNQLMVSETERVLIEARALGVDVEAATARPVRAMLKLDLISSSFAIAVFLLIYYVSVSVLTIFWVVVFNRTAANANGINTWYWSADAITLIAVGVLSDKLRVRKPFMVVGAVGTIVMTFVLISQTGHGTTTGYYSNVFMVVLLGVFIGVAYTPWMAGYTEAVEAHNPALTATGLAVWGWILRIVVAVSFLVLPRVITTATTLTDHYTAGTELQAFQSAQPYVPSLVPGTKAPAPAPASIVSTLKSIGQPGPDALAQILTNFPKTHPSSLTELQAFQAAQPYVPSTAAGAAIPPVAPASVIAELRATGEKGPIALAAILVAYPASHNATIAAGSIPASDGGIGEALALLSFQPLASNIQAGKPVTSAQIQKVSDPNLQQVLRDEILLVPPNTEAAALLRFQPIATDIQNGKTVSNAQIASVGASDLESLLHQEMVIIPAQKASPNEWKRWWWVCMGGQVIFLILIFFMKGRWSPAAAKRDLEDRDRIVAEELSHLRPEPVT